MRCCKICGKKVEAGGGTFFNVPKDIQKREKWSEVCQMTLTSNARICIDHFFRKDIITAGRRLLLMPNNYIHK